jgi:hypothetical protein
MKCLTWKLVLDKIANIYARFQTNSMNTKSNGTFVNCAYIQNYKQTIKWNRPLTIEILPWCYVEIEQYNPQEW